MMTTPPTPNDPTSNQPLPPLENTNDEHWRSEFREVFVSIESGLRRFLSTRLAQSSDVDDCLQAVYLAMEEHGRSVASVSRRAWLFRVAANHSALHWRREAVGRKVMTQKVTVEYTEEDPVATMIESETRRRLRACIEHLPPNYRSVIRLRIDDDLTFEQIAVRMNIPLGTALTWMRRATQRLRTELDNDE